MYRRLERKVWGCLFRFLRWYEFLYKPPFHRIRYLYCACLYVCLSMTAKYCSRVLEAYRSRQDCRYWRLAKILEECIVWITWLMITPSLCYFSSIDFCITESAQVTTCLWESLSKHLVTVSALWHGYCSALSGWCHFDDVKNLEIYNLNLEAYKCFMKPNRAIWLVRDIEVWYKYKHVYIYVQCHGRYVKLCVYMCIMYCVYLYFHEGSDSGHGGTCVVVWPNQNCSKFWLKESVIGYIVARMS